MSCKSDHHYLTSLSRYVRLGEETSVRVTAEADPTQRRETTALCAVVSVL
ncbi:hypothetical protein ACIBQ6_22790 [Nonomuraea sp. NPDC049655]